MIIQSYKAKVVHSEKTIFLHLPTNEEQLKEYFQKGILPLRLLLGEENRNIHHHPHDQDHKETIRATSAFSFRLHKCVLGSQMSTGQCHNQRNCSGNVEISLFSNSMSFCKYTLNFFLIILHLFRDMQFLTM